MPVVKKVSIGLGKEFHEKDNYVKLRDRVAAALLEQRESQVWIDNNVDMLVTSAQADPKKMADLFTVLLKCPNEYIQEEIVRNCFEVDNCYLLILGRCYMLYDKELKILSSCSYGITWECIVCQPGFNNSSLLLCFQLASWEITEDMLAASIFEGSGKRGNSYVTRYTFDLPAVNSFKRSNDLLDSLLLKNEIVTSMLEFAPNKMLLSTMQNQLLVFHDCVPVRAYCD